MLASRWTSVVALCLCVSTASCSGDDDGLSQTEPLPELMAATPSDGAQNVTRTAWLDLVFDEGVEEEALEGFSLLCGDEVEVQAFAVEPTRVIVNPVGEMVAGEECSLTWDGPDGSQSISFGVATAGELAPVPYDRDDLSLIAPFPDDTLLVDDPAQPTGKRFVRPEVDRPPDVLSILGPMLDGAAGLDGFSPLQPIVVELPAPLDPSSLPADSAAAMDPMSTVFVADIDPASPTYGQRLPVFLQTRTETSNEGEVEHILIAMAETSLAPAGRYAFVVTRRAFVDPTRPLAPSEAFAATVAQGAPRATPGQEVVGRNVDEIMEAMSSTFEVLQPDDIALAVKLTVRSMDDAPNDLLSMREQLQAQPPPTIEIVSVEPDTTPGSPVAAIVHGTWEMTSFRDGEFVSRNAQGIPQITGTEPRPFVLALPREPLGGGPAPIIIYQHGQPGSAEIEVPRAAVRVPGFAVLGFTDILNRDSGGDLGAILMNAFVSVLGSGRLPETFAVLVNAEQLDLIRAIPQLADLDVLPIDAPDGVPELDVAAPLGYLGISQGSHHGTGLLAFAPEIRAAALVVGGGRYTPGLIHQEGTEIGSDIYPLVSSFFPSTRRTELYVGLSILQMTFDDQDWNNRARFLYREPLGLGSTPPSLLLVEGVADRFVPANSTSAAAHNFGVPHLSPVRRDTGTLEVVEGPVSENMAPGSTAAFVQYVPSGLEGMTPTPGCEDEPDGHFCAQVAPAALQQRQVFFETAVQTGVPRIE